jgi:hypothetical protein
MYKKSQGQEQINNHFASLLVPAEILEDFNMEEVKERDNELVIILIEKESKVPVNQGELIKDGYLNPVELSHYPVNGKRCFLVLKRRRWKGKHGDVQNIYNHYDYAQEGSKVTRTFGSFLKDIDG